MTVFEAPRAARGAYMSSRSEWDQAERGRDDEESYDDDDEAASDEDTTSGGLSRLASEIVYASAHAALVGVAYATMASLTSYTSAECPR